jgi:pyruvate kinase
MLSGETAAGKYPIESLQTMSRIAERAESALDHREILVRQSQAQQISVTESISQSVANCALDLQAKAIITSTESGYTARMVSKYRPRAPIFAVTPNEGSMRRLALIWGVIPILGKKAQTTDEMFDLAVESVIQAGYIRLGDIVVITAGVPVGRSGTTNLIKVHHVGELLAKGQGIGTITASGHVVTARTPEEANSKMTDGAVLVTISTDKEYMPAFQRASAVITETGGITSHAAVVGLSLGIPVIVGVENVFDLLKDGLEVSIYPEVGVIYSGKSKVM